MLLRMFLSAAAVPIGMQAASAVVGNAVKNRPNRAAQCTRVILLPQLKNCQPQSASTRSRASKLVDEKYIYFADEKGGAFARHFGTPFLREEERLLMQPRPSA
jgi:hypothetical protein